MKHPDWDTLNSYEFNLLQSSGISKLPETNSKYKKSQENFSYPVG